MAPRINLEPGERVKRWWGHYEGGSTSETEQEITIDGEIYHVDWCATYVKVIDTDVNAGDIKDLEITLDKVAYYKEGLEGAIDLRSMRIEDLKLLQAIKDVIADDEEKFWLS